MRDVKRMVISMEGRRALGSERTQVGLLGSDTGGGYVGVCPPIYEAANLCFMHGPLNVSCFTV